MGRLSSFGPLRSYDEGPMVFVGTPDTWLKRYKELYPFSLRKARKIADGCHVDVHDVSDYKSWKFLWKEEGCLLKQENSVQLCWLEWRGEFVAVVP